jgi:hypothetical protein
MAILRVQEVKLVEDVLSLDAEVEKEMISLRNLSVTRDLREEMVELQLNRQKKKLTERILSFV